MSSTCTSRYSGLDDFAAAEILQVGESAAENCLNALPLNTIKHKFVDLKDLQQKISEYLQSETSNVTANQFLVYSNVPEDQVLDDDNEYSLYGGRITYSRTQKFLIIKMPKKAQQVAKVGFTHLVATKISEMGLADAIEETGSTMRIRGDWIKEPDSSWEVDVGTTTAALSAEQEMMKSPSLVLETVITGGCSKDEGEDEITGNGKLLDINAHAWIEAGAAAAEATAETKTETRLVITVQIASDTPHLTIQVWERERERDDNCNDKARAIRTQLVQVSHNNSTNTTTVSGSIMLPFWGVFLRAADVLRNPLERDIVLNEGEIEKIARRIWKVQGFLGSSR